MPKTRESKSKRPVPLIRGILARNVAALRDRVFAGEPNETDRNKQLAARVGTVPSQIQRICSGEVGTSIDYVEWLADALGVRPHDLLTPYFATAKESSPRPDPHPAVGAAPLQPRARA